MGYLHRQQESSVRKSLSTNPVVALIGPRQCGKSTLSKELIKDYPSSLYLDLERPSDLQKLDDAEWFLSNQSDKLICIDEIQRKPNLFPIIRSLCDEWERSGAFLILGSASRDLLKQSAESLAGRISYKRLTPFLWNEIHDIQTLETYLSRGGFPRSFNATDDPSSMEWRLDFISTYLERDMLQWANFTPITMRRLWMMLAHLNGQTVDYSKLGRSLGVSNVTIKNYIDLLESTYMVEVVPAYHSNLGKRLIKSPKVYVADSGLQCALLGIQQAEQLFGHPTIGSVWEQVVLSNIKGNFPTAEIYFYRTSNGAEFDFVVEYRNKTLAIECKSTVSPSLSKGNYLALQDIAPDASYIVAPVKQGWPVKQGIDVISLNELITVLSTL